MIISFFSHTDYTTWVDYSWNPDCIKQEDIEIDIDTQMPILIENDGEFSIQIQDKPIPPKDPEVRKKEILLALSFDNIDDTVIDFDVSDIEIWEIITRLVFDWNPYAQAAMQAKILAMILSQESNMELLQKVQEVQSKINRVRNKFKLSSI